MSALENVVPLILNERHTNDIHIDLIEYLKNKPATYNQIKKNVTKENGEPYSKSYIRKALSQLQYNDVIRKEYVTHKYTLYLINEWNVFKNTWDKRRKRIKRNVFEGTERELPTIEELEKDENSE